MDASLLASLLGSIKSATDIAKFIKDSDLSLEKAEGKLKLAELVSALADAKLHAAEVQQAIIDRDERIRILEAEASKRAALTWREPCYWLTDEKGIEQPYCQRCYDDGGKYARLHSDDAGRYSCRVCGHGYLTRERADRDAAAFKAARRRTVGRIV
jgi:hypothetical protein